MDIFETYKRQLNLARTVVSPEPCVENPDIMSKIEEFEEIKAWGKARELGKEIYRITSIGEFAKDWSLKDQIRRAAVSIMSNIAEGFSRQTDQEFVQFLFIVHPVKYIRRFLFHGAGARQQRSKANCMWPLI